MNALQRFLATAAVATATLLAGELATHAAEPVAVAGESATVPAEPYRSTYHAVPAAPVLIRGATILTGTGARIDGGDVLLIDGRIQAVGRDLTAPAGARIID